MSEIRAFSDMLHREDVEDEWKWSPGEQRVSPSQYLEP